MRKFVIAECHHRGDESIDDWLQRRKLVRTRQEYRKIEKALCQNLIEGPYKNLQDVECIVFEDPEVREGLKEYSNWLTFPQLFARSIPSVFDVAANALEALGILILHQHTCTIQ